MNKRQIGQGGGVIGHSIFERIISLENLFVAWREFRRGKRKKVEIQQFEFNLEDSLFQLHESLSQKTYHPDAYRGFYIQDPKLRHIHKASVRDRVLHQAVFRILSCIFDKGFIFDSYSSRVDKGTHAAVNRLDRFLAKASRNNRQGVYALKCDISKFFDSIDHEILFRLIRNKIADEEALWLIKRIIGSFEKQAGKGLPLGNVTSQLFANIYMNELDQFMKHILKSKYYLRYTDDFLVLSDRIAPLTEAIVHIESFLKDCLRLSLHPKKVTIRPYAFGIDFLGYVLRLHHRVLRTSTKRRLLRRVDSINLQSYFGVLTHCSGFKIKKQLLYTVGMDYAQTYANFLSNFLKPKRPMKAVFDCSNGTAGIVLEKLFRYP